MFQTYTRPGSYFLELMNDHHREDFARAADLGIKPDQREVDEFCRRLSILEGHRYLDIVDQVIGLSIPSGFLHVRVYDEADMFEFASAVCKRAEPLSAAEVTALVTLHDKFLAGRWVETRHLGEIDPGVFDIAIRFEPRERKLERWEID